MLMTALLVLTVLALQPMGVVSMKRYHALMMDSRIGKTKKTLKLEPTPKTTSRMKREAVKSVDSGGMKEHDAGLQKLPGSAVSSSAIGPSWAAVQATNEAHQALRLAQIDREAGMDTPPTKEEYLAWCREYAPESWITNEEMAKAAKLPDTTEVADGSQGSADSAAGPSGSAATPMQPVPAEAGGNIGISSAEGESLMGASGSHKIEQGSTSANEKRESTEEEVVNRSE